MFVRVCVCLCVCVVCVRVCACVCIARMYFFMCVVHNLRMFASLKQPRHALNTPPDMTVTGERVFFHNEWPPRPG